MIGGAAGGGTEQSIFDLLTSKFNLKRTIVASIIGAFFVLGGEYLGSHSDQIIKWVNNRNIPAFAQSFVNSGDSLTTTASMKIGDTEFGQWLQKFVAKDIDGVTYLGRGNGYKTDGGAIIKGKRIVEVNDVPKYRPAKGNMWPRFVVN